MSDEKTNKASVADLKPMKDAKGGRYRHHHGHRQLGGGREGFSGTHNVEHAGKYWL